MKTKTVGVDKGVSYSTVMYGKEGWVNPNHFKPLKFDLLLLRICRNNHVLDQELIGWWTGQNWEGYKIRPTDIIIAWKRTHDTGYVHR